MRLRVALVALYLFLGVGVAFLQHKPSHVAALRNRQHAQALHSTLASIPSPDTRVADGGLFKGLLKDGEFSISNDW